MGRTGSRGVARGWHRKSGGNDWGMASHSCCSGSIPLAGLFAFGWAGAGKGGKLRSVRQTERKRGSSLVVAGPLLGFGLQEPCRKGHDIGGGQGFSARSLGR